MADENTSVERVVERARELLEILDARYPRGQAKQLPGLTLFTAMENLRKALGEGKA